VKGQEEHVAQWALFAGELEPDVRLVEADELLEFVQTEPANLLRPCDDPQRRLYGFVSYRRVAEGKALVRQATLTKVKVLAAHPRAILMETHEKKSSYKARVVAAQAIKPYGWLRVRMMKVVRYFWPLR